MESNPNAKLGFAKAMSNGWIEVDKKNKDGPLVVRKVNELSSLSIWLDLINWKVFVKVKSINDEVQDLLIKIQAMKLENIQEKSIQDLKKRKLISET